MDIQSLLTVLRTSQCGVMPVSADIRPSLVNYIEGSSKVIDFYYSPTFSPRLSWRIDAAENHEHGEVAQSMPSITNSCC